MKPTITIEYCPKCHWLLRAAYMAQELLTTFDGELQSVTLEPRKTNGGFEDIKTIKQMVRDIVSPQKNLGHSDKQ